MAPNRIIGFVVLAIGITLLIMGISASDSFADRLSDAFTGRFTEKTTWYILGGIGATVFGALLALSGRQGKTA